MRKLIALALLFAAAACTSTTGPVTPGQGQSTGQNWKPMAK